MQRFAVLTMICLSVLAGPAALFAAPPASSGRPVLVIAPNPEAVVSGAGGRPVALGRAPLGTLAASAAPDFVSRLRKNGAWFVLDGRALAAICGVVA